MAKGKVYTVGPNTQFIRHMKDKVNYWPGQTFDLDHVNTEAVKLMLARGDVVDVTSKTDEQIGKIVKGYPGITPAQIATALRRLSDSGNKN